MYRTCKKSRLSILNIESNQGILVFIYTVHSFCGGEESVSSKYLYNVVTHLWHSYGTPRVVLHSCRTVRGTVDLYVASPLSGPGLRDSCGRGRRWFTDYRVWAVGSGRLRRVGRQSGRSDSIPLFNHSAPLHPSRVVNNDVQAYAQLYVTLQ